MNTRLLKYASRTMMILVVVELLVGVPTFAYLEFHTYNIVTIHQPDKILNPGKVVIAGSPLIYEIDYCKHLALQASVTRTLVGPVVYPLPVSTNNIPVGCSKSINQSTIVPVGVQPGLYHLELSAVYRVNWLGREVAVDSRTEDFTIVAAPTDVASDASSSSVSPPSAENDGTVVPSASTVPTASQPVVASAATPASTPAPVQHQGLLSALRSAIKGLGI